MGWILPLFCMWGIWDPEKFNIMAKAVNLGSFGTGIPTQLCQENSPVFMP